MGVMSGQVMAYEFGTNWSLFPDFAGGVTGPLLAYEMLTAFFLEAGFLGVMLFGWHDTAAEKNHFALEIPHLGSLILTHTRDGQIPAPNDFKHEDRPNAAIVFWTFRVMVRLEMLMILLGVLALRTRWRGKLYHSRPLLHRAAGRLRHAGMHWADPENRWPTAGADESHRQAADLGASGSDCCDQPLDAAGKSGNCAALVQLAQSAVVFSGAYPGDAGGMAIAEVAGGAIAQCALRADALHCFSGLQRSGNQSLAQYHSTRNLDLGSVRAAAKPGFRAGRRAAGDSADPDVHRVELLRVSRQG